MKKVFSIQHLSKACLFSILFIIIWAGVAHAISISEVPDAIYQETGRTTKGVRDLAIGLWKDENLFYYGNWYGPGYWGGGMDHNKPGDKAPIDSLDAVAQRHDFGYLVAEKNGKIYGVNEEMRLKAIADAIAVDDTLALDQDPRKWPKPPIDIDKAARYRNRLVTGFTYTGHYIYPKVSKIIRTADTITSPLINYYLDDAGRINMTILEKHVSVYVKHWKKKHDQRKKVADKEVKKKEKKEEWQKRDTSKKQPQPPLQPPKKEARTKAEKEAIIKAEKKAKLKAATESPPVTSSIVSKPEVPPKKWADMTKDEKRTALATGQDGAWKSHLDAIIKAQKKEKVTETGGYDPTKDPGAGVSIDPTLIAKVDEISKKFQQETPTGQTSTQTNGALGGGSVSPQGSAYTGGQIGGNSGATVGGGNVGAGIPITVSGIPTLGTPVPTTGGANVGGGTAGGTGAAKPGGATSGSGTGANVGGSSTGKQQCSFNEMCSVLPDSAQLGVNSGLMTQCSRQSGAQTTFTKSWSPGGGRRGVNITMTIYSTVAAAKADVQKYGASCGNGCTPVNIGNGGYKTTNITYPYFKIYSNNVVITYSSHKATRKAIPAQDSYVSNIAQKINVLNCQPSP